MARRLGHSDFGMPTRAELEAVEVDPDEFIAYDQGCHLRSRVDAPAGLHREGVHG